MERVVYTIVHNTVVGTEGWGIFHDAFCQELMRGICFKAICYLHQRLKYFRIKKLGFRFI